MSCTGGSRMSAVSSLDPPDGTSQSIQPTLPGLPPQSGIVSSTPVSHVRVGSSGTEVLPDPQARTVTGKAIGSNAQPESVSMHPADGPETAVAGCVSRHSFIPTILTRLVSNALVANTSTPAAPPGGGPPSTTAPGMTVPCQSVYMALATDTPFVAADRYTSLRTCSPQETRGGGAVGSIASSPARRPRTRAPARAEASAAFWTCLCWDQACPPSMIRPVIASNATSATAKMTMT